ncbi:echinoderm microtubule-associated protein-like CG42247 [Parasteatoda tepidariorum]|uniref:echinoderm microtubule-associated protein-like CG42247 n=1 Tax=Parasteatoda tepidariorum TaxID=114398 RepID=UPI001C71AF80|nr:echinoderm microtubule-associated protein-like CG42247 [Parasteatoda tepidariorum]
MLARELKLGTIEGNFRCRWRVSKSGNTISVVCRQKPTKRLNPKMAAVGGRVHHRWETTRPMMMPKPIVPPKARMVTFYKNGDPFFSGTKVSIMPGKDFVSLDSLCDYLTQRMNIPHGVRFIFSLTGRRVNDLNDLLDGYSYVVSGTKNFQELAYGQSNRMRAAMVSRAHLPLPIRKEDLKLYRPISPNKVFRVRTPKNLRSRSLPIQNEGKTITIVNSQNPTVFSRILLNLRTTQSFEEIVEDLGQAIKLPQAKKIYNQMGDEVRSFSQLKNELKKCETFYIDTERDFSMDLQPESSGSLPNLSGNMKEDLISQDATNDLLEASYSIAISPPSRKRTHKGQANKKTKKAQDGTQVKLSPNKRIEMEWVHGYHGLDPGRNLFMLTTGELAYYVGTIAVLHHYSNATQRHYLGHTEDILCMALHTHDDVLATGQGSGIDNKSQAHIRVWRADDLTTIAVIGQGKLENDIIGAVFSWEGSSMMILEGLQDTTISLWDWQNDTEITRVSTGQSLLGGAFHPIEDDIIVTYGRQHLAFWLKESNGLLIRKDPLSAGRTGTNFLSMEFLSDGELVTGNSRGFITVWGLSEDSGKVFFIQKEFKAHDGEVTALLPLPEGVLVSGGSANDQEGEIRVWDTTKKFANLASAVLPTGSGGVTSLCPQKTVTNEWELFVGTNKNVILEGSVMWALNPVVHGHCDDVRALACHPDKACFVTAGLDRYICKWEVNSLIWKVQSDSECYSITIHPHGSIVAVGDEHGDVTFLNMEDGLHVTTLPVTNTPLFTLKYSPDGDTLAIGGADGNIYLFQTHSNGYMYKIDFVLNGCVPILMLDWSVEGSYLQAVFTDNDYHDIVFWNLKTKEKLHSATQLKAIEWYKPNCTLGYKINGMWNNKHIPDAVHVCCHVSNSKQILAAGDKNGFIRLFRYPSTSDRVSILIFHILAHINQRAH